MNMNVAYKIAFVTPWFGEQITGGAEMEARDLAHHLADAGMNVEILTTCVKAFTSDWNINYHNAGCFLESGLTVRRFPVRTRDTVAFDAVNRKLIFGERLEVGDEKIFLEEMINSPRLMEYIRTHQKEYDIFIFIPYMFGTTYYGVQQCRDKAVMIPCFHEESYAHFDSFAREYSRIAGMVFNAAPEKTLTEGLMDLSHVETVIMGIGMDTDILGNEAYFRRKYGIQGDYILYAGRKDQGKNVDVLLEYFSRWKKRFPSDTKLVLIGGGEIGIPASVQADVIDLGFLSIQDKYDACAGSLFLCQPSQHESFSLVIMESWLCGRPVLVSGMCDVTRNFVQESQGGLYFSNYPEFEACVEYFRFHPEEANQMGKNGGIYVRQHFSWDQIVSSYMKFFERIVKKGKQV